VNDQGNLYRDLTEEDIRECLRLVLDRVVDEICSFSGFEADMPNLNFTWNKLRVTSEIQLKQVLIRFSKSWHNACYMHLLKIQSSDITEISSPRIAYKMRKALTRKCQKEEQNYHDDSDGLLSLARRFHQIITDDIQKMTSFEYLPALVKMKMVEAIEDLKSKALSIWTPS